MIQINMLTARTANSPDEALCNDQMYCRSNQEGFNTHVHETTDGLRRAIGVQGREHQVPGKRGLDCDFRGLEVANLAYENRVRVLTKECAQRSGEVQAD